MTAAPAPDRGPRVAGPAARPPLLLLGAGSAVVALLLGLAGMPGAVPLAAGVLALQLVLVLGALALVDAPAAGGAFLIAAGAAVAGDVVVLVDDGRVDGLAGVVALGLVAALLHQLARRGARDRVTEALSDTLLVVVLVACAACLPALRRLDGGRDVALAALAAAAAALLAGRLGDRVLPRPALAVGAVRGWPGLLLGLGAGVAAAVLVGGDDGALVGARAALLGLAAAAVVSAADLAVDLAAAELRAGWRDARRVAALRPVGLLLPFAVLGPVALAAGQLVLP